MQLSIAMPRLTRVFAVWGALSSGCAFDDRNVGSDDIVEPMPTNPGRSSGRQRPDDEAKSSPGSAGAPSMGENPSPDAGPGAVDAAPDRMVLPPAFAVEEITNWRGGADGAYTIIHDSVCDGSAEGGFNHADPELSRRALRAGFGVIAGSCGEGVASKWPQVRAVAAHGHEILSHSFSFACLGTPGACGARPSSTDFAGQIDRASQLIETHLGAPPTYFVFPYDACSEEAVAHLRQQGYLGARCGPRGISEPSFPDGFATRFDAWGPAFSTYGRSGPCRGLVAPNASTPPQLLPAACRMHVLNQYVDDAISQKGWAIRALGGFVGDPNAFQPIDPADYSTHLDHVRAKVEAGVLWVEGPSEILNYRWAREKCELPWFEANTLYFPTPTPECQQVATRLSYVVMAIDGSTEPNLVVTQGGVTSRARTLARGRYLVNADPTWGPAVLAPAATP